jgi:hypothetical protein
MGQADDDPTASSPPPPTAELQPPHGLTPAPSTPGPTQVVGTPDPFTIDPDVVHGALPQWMPSEIRNNDDARVMADRLAKATRHGGGRLPGIDTNATADFYERVAKGLHTRPADLNNFNTDAKDQRIEKEIAMAAQVRKERPDLTTTRDVAKKVARRLGREAPNAYRTIERRIPPK